MYGLYSENYSKKPLIRHLWYNTKKEEVQTISPIQKAHELLILFYNTRTEMNEFLPVTASIVYLTFHLNSGSDPNYRFSLYAKHYKTSYLFFTRNLQIPNIQTCLRNNNIFNIWNNINRQTCYQNYYYLPDLKNGNSFLNSFFPQRVLLSS